MESQDAEISYWQGKISKRLANELLAGNAENNYKFLPIYWEQLKDANNESPCSQTTCKTKTEEHSDRRCLPKKMIIQAPGTVSRGPARY